MKQHVYILTITLFLTSCQKQINPIPQPLPPHHQEIRFRFQSADLLTKYKPRLSETLAYLHKHSDAVVLVEGHTDELGEENYNLGLGDERARAVKAYLMKNGIDSERIIVLTYGEERLVRLPGESTRGNRRVRLFTL